MDKKHSKFFEKVISAVRSIPRGETRTYKEIARAAGNRNASRAVGNIMNRWGMSKTGIPCHRVVREGGEVGGYADGTRKKIKILQSEGVLIKEGKVISKGSFD